VEVCAPGKVGADRFGDIAGRKAGLKFPVVVVMVSLVVSVVHEDNLALQAIKRFILPFCPNVPGHRQRFFCRHGTVAAGHWAGYFKEPVPVQDETGFLSR
jgi:hypothetical protein